MLAQKTIEQVKAYTDIVGIISEYVPLKKKGRNHLGLCPFHSEKTPSFTVSPEKHIWHCFGCHESGDLISFVMKIDNLTFSEAIIHIAQRAGIEIIEEKSKNYNSKEEKDKETILEILFLARELFAKKLESDETAQEYLKKREILPQTAKDFHIGYSPKNLDLYNLFKEKGYTESTLQKTGLFFKPDYDTLKSRFRGRLIFPVVDYRGRTVGFGGRILEDKPNTAKYVNSEETLFFNKRKLLYALNNAKNTIKKLDYVLIMEGYMDVVIAHQFGFTNAIASMGTALTREQVQKIKRFTSCAYLAMDQDTAGQEAIIRSYEILKQEEFKVNIINFSAKDPADILLSKGSDHFQHCIDQAIPMIEYKFKQALSKYDTNKIENIPDIIEEVIPILRSERNNIVQKLYVKKIANHLKIAEELIVAKIKKHRYNIRQNLFTHGKKRNKYQKSEERLIYLMASNCELRQKISEAIDTSYFSNPLYAQLFTKIKSSNEVDNNLLNEINDEKLKALLSGMFIEGEQYLDPWEECIRQLKEFKIEEKSNHLKTKIKELEVNGKEEEAAILLKELSCLRKIMD